MVSNPAEVEDYFELESPPEDGISTVKFYSRQNTCVVASWDTSVSIHNLISSESESNIPVENENNADKTVKITEYNHEAGVLDIAITPDDSTIYSVGCDFALRSFNIQNSNSSNNNNNNNNNSNSANSRNCTLIGYHSQPIRCVEYAANKSMIITGSWDKTIKLWDVRMGNENENENGNAENGNANIINDKTKGACVGTYELSNKVFAMSMQNCGNNNQNDGTKLIIGTSDRQVYIYDIRNMSSAEQIRESSLKHQTRTVVCHPNNKQYVLASIEGRVAVEYLDTNETIQKKKYAFKCHRQSAQVAVPAVPAAPAAGVQGQGNNGDAPAVPAAGGVAAAAGVGGKTQTVFPVNAVAFHPGYHTFATGGGDGVVNIWDGENKKRICQFPRVNTSISSVDFNYNGTILGIGKSYTWEKGDLMTDDNGNGISIVKDNVMFRKIGDSQAKPKQKAKKKKQALTAQV